MLEASLESNENDTGLNLDASSLVPFGKIIVTSGVGCPATLQTVPGSKMINDKVLFDLSKSS